MINSITVAGRATRDAEFKALDGGQTVAKFTLAVDNPGRDKGASFFDCEVWGKASEVASQYVKKGGLYAVSGRMESRKHEERTFWTVKADQFRLGPKTQDASGGEFKHASMPSHKAPASYDGAPPDLDEMPF